MPETSPAQTLGSMASILWGGSLNFPIEFEAHGATMEFIQDMEGRVRQAMNVSRVFLGPSVAELPKPEELAELEQQHFAAWVERHVGCRNDGSLTPSERETLEQESPFFAAVLAERDEPLRRFYQDRRRAKIRARIRARDVRCENRRRRALGIEYLNSNAALLRFGGYSERCHLQNATKAPTWPFPKGTALISEHELLELLESELEAINRELEAEGQEPARMDFWEGNKGMPALVWDCEVSDIEDEKGREHDLGTYTVYLLADGDVYATGGSYQRCDHIHPHLSNDGSLCRGDYQNLKDMLCVNGALATVFGNVCNLLRTYNHDSPYLQLRTLVGLSNHGAEDEDDDEESDTNYCEHCDCEIYPDEENSTEDGIYCDHCSWRCNNCGEAYARHRKDPIDVDGVYYCQSCAEDKLTCCEGCGQWIDSDNAHGVEDDHGDTNYYCGDCVTECDDCGEYVLDENIIRKGRHNYCPDCVTECEMCGKEIAAEDASTLKDKDNHELSVCCECYLELDDYEEPDEPQNQKEQEEECCDHDRDETHHPALSI